MVYKVGISTGWWRIAKSPELLGLAAKVAYGATTGVRFVQADVDTTSEFLEPGLKLQIQRVKELGMEVGVHAEVGEVMALESAEWRLWDQSQKRLCETVKHAADLGFVYVNVHLSTKPQLAHEESRLRVFGTQYPVVSYDGRALFTVCDKIPEAKAIAQKNIMYRTKHDALEEASEKVSALEKKYSKKMDDEIKAEMNKLEKSEGYQKMSDAEKRQLREQVTGYTQNKVNNEYAKERDSADFVYECWKNAYYSKYILDNSELGAYEIIAHLMVEQSDPLWSNICGGKPSAAYFEKQPEYNAALSAKYIEGHLTSNWHTANKELLDGMSIRGFCEKNKIYLLFEVPEASEGQEGIYRFYNPLHAYHMIKKLNSSHIKLCIDFEHMLAHKLEPDKIISKMQGDAGKQILLFHLGRPIPYFGTAHVPITRGSHAQEHIYRWLWNLKQKGFSEGYMIYERGGGQTPLEVVQDTVQTLRLIATELEKDTKPDELPASFYGITEQNEAVFARQRVAIKDNFMAPISGMLSIPEETHTFFGRAAIEKGRAEEWKKGKYR